MLGLLTGLWYDRERKREQRSAETKGVKKLEILCDFCNVAAVGGSEVLSGMC